MYKTFPPAFLKCARSKRFSSLIYCRLRRSRRYTRTTGNFQMEEGSSKLTEAGTKYSLAEGTAGAQDYSKWSQSALVQRVLELEKAMASFAKAQNSVKTEQPSAIAKKPTAYFDFSRYSTRLIALKFAYFGSPYQGYEYHGNETMLPSVEEKLFEALLKARMVQPRANEVTVGNGEKVIEREPVYRTGGWSLSSHSNVEGGLWKWLDMEKWQYTKCGRTDKGVSAFSQVIGIRVVSNRPNEPESTEDDHDARDQVGGISSDTEPPEEPVRGKNDKKNTRPWDEVNDELDYISKLNTLLPPSIRVLAWCPNPPKDFSARFSCKGRTYHYYFTNPVFPPGLEKGGNRLDIDKMREAAKHFEGLHDFRNFCKLDPSKQITNFMRRIFSATIEKVEDPSPQKSFVKKLEGDDDEAVPELYYFRLKGTAFLWNQVRHMVAVLFLIGQGLESPEVIPKLLDTASITGRPNYELADDRPLVLWDCDFDPEEVKWVYPEIRMKKYRPSDLLGSAWGAWHMANMDATLAGGLMSKINEQARNIKGQYVQYNPAGKKKKVDNSQVLFDGSAFARSSGKYVPLLEKKRLDPVEVMNKRFADKKGAEWKEKWGAEARRTRREIDGEYDDDGE